VTASQGHSPVEAGIGDAGRADTETSVDLQWLEMSRKRTASGSCISPRSLKSASPAARSKHDELNSVSISTVYLSAKQMQSIGRFCNYVFSKAPKSNLGFK